MAKSSAPNDRPDTDDDEPLDEAAPQDGEDAADGGSAGEDAAGDDAAEDKAAAAEPAAKAKTKTKGKAKGVGAAARRAAAKEGARRVPVQPQPQGGSLGKSMILFLIIIGGLAGAFAYFGRETGGGGAPKWKVGDRADVEITLVATDLKDLACWSAEEVKGGLHCAFESPTKGWSKGDAEDAKLLKPYTTTDRVQFLAAGVWSQPAITGAKLPSARFALKCSYSVEGKVKRPGIRWSAEGAWSDRTDDWYAGVVSDCKLLNP